MELFELLPNFFAPVICGLTIAAIHKWLGWSLLASAAVGFIPGLILGYLVGFAFLFAVGLVIRSARRKNNP